MLPLRGWFGWFILSFCVIPNEVAAATEWRDLLYARSDTTRRTAGPSTALRMTNPSETRARSDR
jgi:hypothetical protein